MVGINQDKGRGTGTEGRDLGTLVYSCTQDPVIKPYLPRVSPQNTALGQIYEYMNILCK